MTAAQAARGSGSSVLERQTILEEHSISYSLLAFLGFYFRVQAAGFLGQEGGFQRIHVLAFWGSVRPVGHPANNVLQQFSITANTRLGAVALFSVLRGTGTLWQQDVTWRFVEITQLGDIIVITCRNICILSSRFLLQEVYHRSFQMLFPREGIQPLGISFLKHVC